MLFIILQVRAQAVLRQNQTVDHSQEEQLKEETAALRSQIQTLTVKLTTLQYVILFYILKDFFLN